MGGGSSRKTKDKPTIGLRNKGGVSSGSGGGSKSSSKSDGDVCQSSFQVKIADTVQVKEGQVVVLRKNRNETHDVYLGTKLIASLSKATSEMVSTCFEMKVTYAGTVIKQKNGFFARFIRQ